MIIDSLGNAPMYYNMCPRIAAALRWLQEADLAKLELGKHSVEGDEIYALVQEYDTKPAEDGYWEAHRQYVDVQYVASGTELMGYANVNEMVAGDYDAAKDKLVLDGDGDFFMVTAGNFVVFAPQDAHMPGACMEKPEKVRKVVVKVRMQQAAC